MLHRHASDCRCCSARGTVQHPSGAWTAALVAGYVVFAAMVFGAAMLGLGLLAVIPWLAMGGLGLLPFLHDRAGAPPVCSACGKIAVSSPVETEAGRDAVAHPEPASA